MTASDPKQTSMQSRESGSAIPLVSTVENWMPKALGAADGAVIGLSCSRDLYEKLKSDAARLASDWGVYACFDFAVTAWHLQEDWVQSDPPKAPCRIKRGQTQRPPEMQLALDVIHDLANGSKHFHLDQRGRTSRTVTATRERKEAGWWSYFWHEDMPGVSVGSYEFSIRVLRNIIMAYFDWVFDDTLPVAKFPVDIVEAVRHCDISSRKPPFKPPLLWSKR
jgi:hypothetical protein